MDGSIHIISRGVEIVRFSTCQGQVNGHNDIYSLVNSVDPDQLA